MGAELPVILTVVTAIVAGWRQEGKFPVAGFTSVVSGIALLLIVSIASRTPLGPLVNAIAWLMFLAVTVSAVPIITNGTNTDGRRTRVNQP